MGTGFLRREFRLLDTEDVTDLIAHRLSRGKPTSIVRLGDGEGAVLARPDPRQAVLWAAMEAHFGPTITTDQIGVIADDLTAAIDDADIIGVRDDVVNVIFPAENLVLSEPEFLQAFRQSFLLREAERDIRYDGALRLAYLHRFLTTHAFKPSAIFCSAWLHFRLSASCALVRMMREQANIGLISSRHVLARRLAEEYGIGVDFYEIPERNVAVKAIRGVPFDFPGWFERSLDTLKVCPGQLFLVGAGVVGKLYCGRIKALGGIALDVGAVCDAWLGIPSRRKVYRSLFGTEGAVVPPELLLDRQFAAIK